MGVKRLQIKDNLNYRRGYTWKACGYCDHYITQVSVDLPGKTVEVGPCCRIIGINPGRLYRINQNYLCDKYEYHSPLEKEFQATQPKDDYEPYGPEWEKEMMKLDKKTLISMLKAKGLEG